ncbi:MULTISPECIES: hypothetical protein [unclassified Mycobacterium]|uniref:hypothetical protein n=1 Tax=unclassified Mycobacterium TaxID=2642494 RepID=UPI0029C7939B|nr:MULTISPECIES: hypothetical protein [unclassified Mycobacterium]
MAAGLNQDGSILFLSCDLQNSTQFKQSHTDGWIATFLAFYTEFPSLLATEIADSCPGLRDRLSLWKAVGDEVIFSVRIQSEQECSDAVDAWLLTMLAFESQHLLRKTPMTLKGGAFLATVPSPDRRVAIPRTVQILDGRSQLDAEAMNEATLNRSDESGDFAIDFVGPSIDTGFRVLKFASRRYFVLTVEVAHLLFKHYSDKVMDDRIAYLLGTHSLKGVWGGQSYPVFALARALEGDPPARLLAEAFGSSGLITDEYPRCKPYDALKAIAAYRAADSWQGAIHVPDAHEKGFQKHPTGAEVRAYLDNLVDTSEDRLDNEQDQGEENSVAEDLPTN